MLNMENWSPELKAIYQNKHPAGQADTAASPMRQSEPFMAHHGSLQPDGVLGSRTLGQSAGPSLGMPMQAPSRVRREASLTPTASQPPSAPTLAPDARDPQVDRNAQAYLNPPAVKTSFTPLQGAFQKIDTQQGYTDDLPKFETAYKQWKDYYARSNKVPNKYIGANEFNMWPQRMKDYYDAWDREYNSQIPGAEADPNAPKKPVPSFFEEMDNYFHKIKLAQRDDPSYVPAAGQPPGGEALFRHEIPGVYPEAMFNYKASKFTPEEQKFLTQEITPSIQTHRTAQQEGHQIADDLSGGQYDVGDLMSQGLEAQTTGQPDHKAYDPVLKHAMDSVVDRYQRDIRPAISDEAQAYGQYGGSRQGVAEGMAAKGLEETLGNMSTRMNLQAYQDAQSRVIPATQARAGLRTASLQDQLSHREKALLQRSARTKEGDDYIARILKHWRHGQDANADALNRYLSMLKLGSPGPSSEQEVPQFRNKKAEWLGAAATVGAALLAR